MSKKKKEVLEKEREKFVAGCLKNNCNQDAATKIYDLILKFANYGFNKSHSVAYAMVGYKMGYLKAMYPAYFITALLSQCIGSETKTKEYVNEARLNNLKVLAPDINYSYNHYVVKQNTILMPLNIIKNIGVQTTKTILEERELGLYKDIFDFVSRMQKRGIGLKTIEQLIKAGCFSHMTYNKKTLIDNLDVISNYGELIIDLERSVIAEPTILIKDEYSAEELLAQEIDSFGFYIRNHPTTKYKIMYKAINANALAHYFNKTVNLVVMLDKINSVETKNKDTMYFLTGSDDTASVEIVVFPKQVRFVKDINRGKLILVKAQIEKRLNKYQAILQNMKVLN